MATDQQEPVTEYRDPIPNGEDFEQAMAEALGETEEAMNAPVEQPAEEIKRPSRRRGKTAKEPQIAFGDTVLDIPADDATQINLYLGVYFDTLEAAREFNAAKRDIKKWLENHDLTGEYTDLRIGEYLLNRVMGSGEPVHMEFTREPSVRTTIRKAEAE